ncbi:MAG: NAD-dependent epimerase/dehydratase family protein [Planctomycetota bacterium]
MAETVVVTGVAGFIGSHLAAALLARGCRVVGVDNLDPFYDASLKEANLRRLAGERFEHVRLDILEAGRLAEVVAAAGPDLVCHVAALAGVRPSLQNPARYMRVNVDGTVSVLDAARAAGCGRVVFASSSSVYGNNRKVPFAETDPVDAPISPYAASKRSAELICHAYGHLFGLTIAALRFFTVYGPAQRPDLAIGRFMRLVAEDREVPMFGDGSTSRDYTYVDDIIAGVLAAADRTASLPAGTFRVFNLGGAHPVTLSDMIAAVGRVVGREPRVHRLPAQPGDVNRTWADLTRSGAEIGYHPTTPFEEGLARQWAWMRGQAALESPPTVSGT